MTRETYAQDRMAQRTMRMSKWFETIVPRDADTYDAMTKMGQTK